MTTKKEKKKRYWLCPLYSFNSDEEVILSKVAQIKHAPLELKRIIQERSPTESKYAIDNPTHFNWVMKFPSPEDYFQKPGNNTATRIPLAMWALNYHILALRLHKRGLITPGVVRYVEENGSRLTLLESFETTLCKHGFNKEPKYSLTESDLIPIQDIIYDLYSYFEHDPIAPYRITFDRFHSAYHERPEDALIDQIIAFESLLLDDDKELGYKLSLRTAFLIGEERETIFNNMKEAYNLRSLIVHGKKDIPYNKINDILPITEEYLRRSIKIFISLLAKGKSIKSIRKMLDKNILKNGTVMP